MAGAQERAGRVGHVAQPGAGHLEDARLLGRAEAVLGRAQQPQRAVPVALQHEHHVHEVLQRAGPGEAAVLGHVTHEDRGRAVLMRPGGEPRRGLPDLAHRPGWAIQPVDRQRLHRVDDDEPGSCDLGGGKHAPRGRSRRAPDAGARAAFEEVETRRPQVQLLR